MPSDVKISLSSVLSSTALRLSALVAAAMSAGYLWRAAVEPGGAAAKVTAAQPDVRLQPRDVTFNSLDLLRPAEPAEEPAGGGQAAAVARRAAKPQTRSSVQLVSVTVSAPQSGSAVSAPVRRPTHPVQTKPKPPKSGRKPRPKPPPPPPRPKPPPPAPQPPPPPPPPPVAPPAPPPPPPVAGGETRPGWGKGDRNHRHTGPPGQQKPKKGKGAPGNPGSQGQSGSSGEQGGGGHGNGRGKKGKG